MVLFDNFKQLLQLIASNAQTVSQNVVLANTAYAQSIADHISALTPDYNIRLNTTKVASASGLLVSDTNRREIRFEPKGSGKVVQGFLEANISDVTKIWQRSADSTGNDQFGAPMDPLVPYGTLSDGRRYYVTDSSAGVFYLNEYGQILGSVPGFDASAGYGTPVAAITFIVGIVEYLAIISEEHTLSIYDTDTFTLVSTFGAYGAPLLPDAPSTGLAITGTDTITRADGGNWTTNGFITGGDILITSAEDGANDGVFGVLTSVGAAANGALVIDGTPALTDNANDTAMVVYAIHTAVGPDSVGTGFAFDNATKRITRNDGGNWLADNFSVGDYLRVVTAEDGANDGIWGPITDVQNTIDGYITIATATFVTNADDTTVVFTDLKGKSGPYTVSPGLYAPLDLAFNEATSTLYVSCAGNLVDPYAPLPAGATGPGFIASFDLTVPAAPVFGEYMAVNAGKTLHQCQVLSPVGLFYDSELEALWILSEDTSLAPARPFEIGALSVTGTASNNFLKGYVEYKGADFVVTAANRLHVDVARRRMYLTNSPGIEVFDLVTMKHLYTFGYYGQDESASATNAPFFTPSAGEVRAVCADIVDVDGVQVSLAVFDDSTNNRLVRISENSYEGENVVIFSSETFTVPISLHGYLVKGTLSSSKVQLEFRTSATGAWQILSQTDSVPASIFFQFRIKVTADLRDIIQENSISEVTVIGEME